MRRATLILLILSVCTLQAFAQSSTPAATSSQPSTEQMLTDLRKDMQAKRADVMAKNLILTADQAAKFWPLFNQYQKEQNVIMDEQLKGIQQFVDNFETLDDTAALQLMNAHLDRDAKMNALRKKWLGEFQKAVPAKIAVRAMQIDRRLSLAMQAELASHIPLVY